MSDKASVAAIAERYIPEHYLRRFREEIAALSPAQGDGMRDALVSAFAIYLARMKMEDGQCGAIDLAGVAMRALASHPDRQPDNPELHGQPDRRPSDGEE